MTFLLFYRNKSLSRHGNWYIMGQSYQSWGRRDDIPVPGQFDADPNLDITVLRPANGKWYIRGLPAKCWYRTGDYPLPVRDTNADGDPHQ
jgi:hypothetical protein